MKKRIVKRFIYNYCEKHNCTFQELSEATGIPCSYLRHMDTGRVKNISVPTAMKLYDGSKRKYGDPIYPWDVAILEGGIPPSIKEDFPRTDKQ